MYRTCLFCHADLGRNLVVEELPIGRRLAFDARLGRLWVVCRACERWNLTPFDERWEAIERCERLFRETRTRLSTDQIGLARLREGTELVRIGTPLRPEFAAWRYGDQFGRRRRKYLALAGVGGAIVVGAAVAPLLVTGTGIGGGAIWNVYGVVESWWSKRRVAVRLPMPQGTPLALTGWQVQKAQLTREADGRTTLSIPGRYRALERTPAHSAVLDGQLAEKALQHMLPHINRHGASKGRLGTAVRLLEESPDYSRLAGRIASPAAARGNHLDAIEPELRLALEMAVHEDAERRWLAGQLLELEEAWRQAESLAAIADRLGVPAEIEARLERLRVSGR